MTLRGMWVLMALLAFAGATAQVQETPPPDQPGTVPLIKTETRLVLLDTVVTDKKGQYVPNLEAKNFKVWEDNRRADHQDFLVQRRPQFPHRE